MAGAAAPQEAGTRTDGGVRACVDALARGSSNDAAGGAAAAIDAAHGVIWRRLRLQELERRCAAAFGRDRLPAEVAQLLQRMRAETAALEARIEGRVALPPLRGPPVGTQPPRLPLRCRCYVVHLPRAAERLSRAKGLAASLRARGAEGGVLAAVDGQRLRIDAAGRVSNSLEGGDAEGGVVAQLWDGWRLSGDALRCAVEAARAPSSFGSAWQGWRDYGRPLREGEVGCALSHLAAWRAAAAAAMAETDGLEAAIVLEDDAVGLERCWEELGAELEALRDAGCDWDVLYLGRVRAPGGVGEDGRRVSARTVRAGFSYATHGYVLSAAGARKLANGGLERCVMPLDEWLPATYACHPRADLRAAMEAAGAPRLRALAWRSEEEVHVQGWGCARGLLWQAMLGSATGASADITL